jgi:hypothetical protein
MALGQMLVDKVADGQVVADHMAVGLMAVTRWEVTRVLLKSVC